MKENLDSMASKPLKILLVAAEVAPFAKVGGLADVAGALPKALQAQGHDVRVAMPCYKMIETAPEFAVEDLLPAFSVPIRPGVTEQAYVKVTRIQRTGAPKGTKKLSVSGTRGTSQDSDIPVYLIGNVAPPRSAPSELRHPAYFQQVTDSTKVYVYAPEPYVFFNRAVLEMLAHLQPEWIPDVIHCNDWHTGLIPVYQRLFYADSPLGDPAILFTIHNLAYQGNFSRDRWEATGLPPSLYDMNHLEFYGEWTFMKGGLTFSDRINTVSPNYAREIQTAEYGCGLDGLMRTLQAQGKLSGILNGIDYETFDPATDPHIPYHYQADAPANKAKCKEALQTELGLPASSDTALIGLVSRLADQKGFDLIYAIVQEMLSLPIQFVLLGTGDPRYAQFFKKLQTRRPQQVQARIEFNVELAQRIYAGSDLFLMPSRFEPCGLGQMISLRYGTVPIVRATGGLADTVQDFDPTTSPEGNGFVFTEYTGAALLETVRRAVAAFQKGADWQSLIQRAMRSDFSWTRSAAQYTALYAEAAADHLSVKTESQFRQSKVA
jgi:starch synthase